MKGDIAFAGFMLTAAEWQALDADDRAKLIAVATRRADPDLERPRRFPDGTGKHEIIDFELDCADLIDVAADDDAAERVEPVSIDGPDDGSAPASSSEPAVDGGWEDFADLNEI